MVPNGPRHPKHWVKVSKPVSSRLPLWTIRKIRIVKFWWKLLESESYILKSVYQDLFKRTEKYPCVKYRRLLNVKKMLLSLPFWLWGSLVLSKCYKQKIVLGCLYIRYKSTYWSNNLMNWNFKTLIFMDWFIFHIRI